MWLRARSEEMTSLVDEREFLFRDESVVPALAV